jgi:hypothetical protein
LGALTKRGVCVNGECIYYLIMKGLDLLECIVRCGDWLVGIYFDISEKAGAS